MVPMVSLAADKEMDETVVSTVLDLKGGKPGKKVKKTSTGSVNRDIKTFEEYLDAVPTITLTKPEGSGHFYWTEKAYKNQNGNKESIAVLKEDGNVKKDIIIKVEDIANFAAGIVIEMGAAPDGPAKYKISYSTDCGKTWKKMDAFGTDRGKISKANSITTVFRKNIGGIERTFQTKTVKEKIPNDKKGTSSDYDWKMKLYDDIYFKVSAVSADSVDGKNAGNIGEWGIRSVSLLEGRVTIDLMPHKPGSLRAYKTAKKEITLNWEKSKRASGYDIYLKKPGEKYKKIKSVKGLANTSYKIKNLLPAGNYKVKICSYIGKGGEKARSSFTKPVSINMKSQPLPKDIVLKGFQKLEIGERKQFAVKCINGTKKDFIKDIKFKVKNHKIAKVNNMGIVEGKKGGTTKLEVTVKLKSGLTKKFTRKIKVVN